jgi:hypothetical protein
MAPKKELQLAYGLVAVLLVVGVLSYAASSAGTPEVPIRLVYKVVAGKVLFDHQTHAGAEGYALACGDCHHHPPYDDSALRACGDCHNLPPEDAEGMQVPEACLECHGLEDPEVTETEMLGRGDAFHDQCIGCHQDYGAGAVECAACHVQ